MAIADYAGLVEGVQKWCARSDSTFTNRIPDFVAMAEDRIYHGADLEARGAIYSAPLRNDTIEHNATLTFASGVADLPTDYLAARRVYRSGDTLGLTYMPPERFSTWDAYGVTGFPTYYTIEDGQIKTTPGYDGTMTLLYWRKLPALTVEENSNLLLTAHPMVYLTATLFEAFSFIQEQDLALGHVTKLRAMVDGLNKTASAGRVAGGSLRVLPRNPIP